MNYQVIIESFVEKQVLELDKKTLKRIIDSIEKLKFQPRPNGCSKLQVLDGYRIRVGDYRILYTISDPNKIVTIYKISKREEAYRSS